MMMKNYDENHMKIKFNLDDELTLNITIEVSTMKIVVRTIFHENNKYYSQQVFSDECVKNIKMDSKNEFKKNNLKNCTC